LTSARSIHHDRLPPELRPRGTLTLDGNVCGDQFNASFADR